MIRKKFNPTQVNEEELARMKQIWLDNIDKTKPVRIFAYGSLLWKPDCQIGSMTMGMLNGYQRDFCLYSYMYRGSVDNLGLVLGLKQDGHCCGGIMHLCPDNIEKSLSDIWDREMITGAYIPILLPVIVTCPDYNTQNNIKQENPEVLHCWVFIANTQHNQWAGQLTIDEQASLISKAVGEYGSNSEYLFNTVGHLKKLGLNDNQLELLMEKTQQLINNSKDISN